MSRRRNSAIRSRSSLEVSSGGVLSIGGISAREASPKPRRSRREASTKPSASSVTGQAALGLLMKTMELGFKHPKISAATISMLGVTAIHQTGDTIAKADSCTGAKHQQVVVSTPYDNGIGKIRQISRGTTDILFRKSAPAKDNGIYPYSSRGLVETLESERGYAIGQAQFDSLNRNTTAKDGTPLFDSDEDGVVENSFSNDGIYCVRIPGPIRSGSHLTMKDDTSIEEVADAYNVPTERIVNLNPHVKEFEVDEDLPEGTTLAIHKKQGNFVLSHIDPQDLDNYLDDKKGYDRETWNKSAWASRAYTGVTESFGDSDVAFVPYKVDKAGLLPAAQADFFKDQDKITPKRILKIYPDTALSLPNLKQKQELRDRNERINRGESFRDLDADPTYELSGTMQSHLKSRLEKLGVPEEFTKYYIDYGQRYNVSPFVLAAKDYQESRWNPNVRNSRSGATGIGQVWPPTWEDYKSAGIVPKDAEMTDPKWNIKGNTWYLRQLIDRAEKVNYSMGDLQTALAAYNAGPGNVFDKYHGMPPFAETKDYVEKITGNVVSMESGTVFVRRCAT